MEDINRERLSLLNASVSQNTQTTYQTAVNTYNAFTTARGLIGYPMTVNTLCSFIAYLSLENKSFNTINTYIAGLSYWLKSHDLPDITKVFIIKQMLNGVKRKKHSVDQRFPITPEILQKLINCASIGCYTLYEASMYRAAYLLSFCCFLRLSEISVYSNSDSSNWFKTIQVADVKIYQAERMEVTINYSKTQQYGQPVTLSVDKCNGNLCAVTAVSMYLQQRPPGNGPLFIHYNKLPLCRNEFVRVLRKLLKLAGVTEHIRSHSFRIGAASCSYANGIPEAEIQEMGRWASSCYKRYIRLPSISVINLGNTIH